MARLMLLLCVVASTVFISYAGTAEKPSLEDNPLEESNLEEAGKDVDQSADPAKKPKEKWEKEWIQINNEEDEAKNSKPAGWRKVNKWPVCFEAKGSQFGRFYVPGGRLAALKLVHLYGYVSCVAANPTYWSYWGCGDNRWKGLNTQVNVVITDLNNHILLPPIQFQKTSNLKWYKVPGYNSLSPELVLHFFTSPKWVHPNQELRVWYGENLVKINRDNGGKVCADVYALFV